MASPLFDLVAFAADLAGLKKQFNELVTVDTQKDYTSIAARASESILQCPVVCSKSIEYETALLMTKACERYYADFALKVMTLSPVLGKTNADAIDFIRQFHQNEQTPGEIIKFEESAGKVFVEGTFESSYTKGNAAHLESIKPFDADFNNGSINKMLKSSSLSECRTSLGILTEAKINKGLGIDVIAPKGGVNISTQAPRSEVYQMPKDVLMASDVRKANEMVPSNFRINFHKPNPGAPDTVYDFPIGVKCALHDIPSVDMVAGLVDACEYKGTLYNFIRFTSGEIKFFRDFFLNLGEIKKDVVNKEMSKSRWLPYLKNLSRQAAAENMTSHKRLPNATLIISQEEVDYIKANYNYDLNDEKMAARVMKTFFLLSFVVVDSADEVIHILTDGINNNRFQLYTFKSLERDNDNAERQFKQILKAVNKL